jgi:hypothetical protein
MVMKRAAYVLSVFMSVMVLGLIPFAEGQSDHGHHMHEGHAHHMPAPAGPEPVVDMETVPAEVSAGSPAMVTFLVRDDNGNPMKDLSITHDRILHVIIISEDLSVFGHIHAEDLGPVTPEMKENARFPVRYTFPKAGNYVMAVDFAAQGRGFSELLDIEVAGSPRMGKVQKDFGREKGFEGYQVKLTLLPEKPVAGKETTLRYLIMKDGKPVSDIEPYLSAAMHLAVINEGVQHYFVHAHGDRPGAMQHKGHEGHMAAHMGHSVPAGAVFGPEIEASVIFPVKGVYKIFSEIKHQGRVRVLDFMVTVE